MDILKGELCKLLSPLYDSSKKISYNDQLENIFDKIKLEISPPLPAYHHGVYVIKNVMN